MLKAMLANNIILLKKVQFKFKMKMEKPLNVMIQKHLINIWNGLMEIVVQLIKRKL